MRDDLEMTVRDIFHLRDGRTVLVGPVAGDPGFVGRRPFQLWLDGEFCGTLEIEGEMISHGPGDAGEGRLRSLSTTSHFPLDRDSLADRRLILKPHDASTHRGHTMHRHLIGVESPPSDYVADPMTLGPVLPEGWDGDAWAKAGGRGYFLRAWTKQKEDDRVAYGRGLTYDEARRQLLDVVASGGLRVSISTHETAPR